MFSNGLCVEIRGLISTEQVSVASRAGFELWEFAVCRTLRARGHLPASGELQVGFRDPEGCFVVVAPLVEGGEPLVGVATDELFGDADLVQAVWLSPGRRSARLFRPP